MDKKKDPADFIKYLQTIDKKAFIKHLQTERSRIENMLAEMNSEQMELPGVQGDWSVKNIIAHLTIWERRGIEWIKAAVQEKEPEVPLPRSGLFDIDQLNTRTYEESEDRSIEDILSEFHQVFWLLMNQVELLDEEQLDKIIQAKWTGNTPVPIRFMIAWRFIHYQSHGRHIQAWLETNKQK
ncbi:MAG: ClbS/DfsB family four-helix bundle protein [Candidatus Hermodarchaeota archaeon]